MQKSSHRRWSRSKMRSSIFAKRRFVRMWERLPAAT